MCISKNANNIVYPSKICHVNVNNKDSAAQREICQSWVHIKVINLITMTTNISKAHMSPGTVFPVAVKFFLLEH